MCYSWIEFNLFYKFNPKISYSLRDFPPNVVTTLKNVKLYNAVSMYEQNKQYLTNVTIYELLIRTLSMSHLNN